MKRFFVVCLFLFSVISIYAQQTKQVYITLDVSGSMTGDKYILANYTTQMIVTLCDDDDDVSMIVYGVAKNLSKEKNPLKVIQQPMYQLRFGNPRSSTSQFEDIIGFNKVYSPDEDKQDWLFIIGDGDWGTSSSEYSSDCNKFRKTVEGGTLNVCYLQTGHELNEYNDFTEYAEDLKVVDIAKSSTDAKTILEGCDHFAKKILGFSETSLSIKKDGSNAIKMVSELPLVGFLLVYQDEVMPSRLPKITNANAGSTGLNVKHKGTPTTQPIRDIRSGKVLSGNVWRVESSSTIPAKTSINIEFDKDVDKDKVRIYPIVKDIEFGSCGLTVVGDDLSPVKDSPNTYSICRDERSAVVRIDLDEDSKENLPEELLKEMKVVVKANNKEYKATYKNGAFECTINLKEEKTPYYAECDLPGYFKRITPIATIVKGDCLPPEIPQDVRPMEDLGTISFQQLKEDDIRFTILDEESQEALNPNLFDISLDAENEYLFDNPNLHVEDGQVVIELHPSGGWCECLFPEGLNFKIVSTPKGGAFEEYGKNYKQTTYQYHFSVEKESAWLTRCFWVLVTLVALLLVIFYLRALLKKNRFHKRARLKNLYFVDDEPKEIEKSGRPLRQPGFSAWCSRWLNPFGDERATVSFIRPRTRAITFIASPSKIRILMSPASFDAASMVVPNYTPKGDNKRSRKDENPIGISSGNSIEIKKTQAGETTRLGHLKFIAEGKDDEGGFRVFIGLLLFAAVVAFFTLLVLLIRSFV